MKRLLTLAATFLCCMATTFAQFSGSGSGTENDPYLILNPIQLNQMRNFLNQSGVYFKLMADINLTDFIEEEYPSQGWLPIGTGTIPFTGILDGNGKTISGLVINRSSTENVGLFAYVAGSNIKDLTIKAQIVGLKNVGILVGKLNGKNNFSNINIEGNLQGSDNVGGLIGTGGGSRWNDNKCDNIVTNVRIQATGNNIGGITGLGLNVTLTGCKVLDSFVSGNNNVGGISGRYGHCVDCCFVGSALGNSYVGGISGNYCGIIRSYALGTISASGDYVGGLIGSELLNDGNTESYFCGTVSGKNYVGGIAGKCDFLTMSYANAIVKGESKVGGICGYHDMSTISRCVYYGPSLYASEGEIARILGAGSVDVGEMGTNNENKALNRAIVIKAGISQDIIDDRQNGTGVSATTLKHKATYVAMGWDFSETWEIQETECYPYFKTQTAPPVVTSTIVSGATTISGKCIDGGTITLDIDGVTQQIVSSGNEFSFSVNPLQTGQVVRVSAKAEGKEQSYFAIEIVTSLGSGKENDPYQVYTAADLTSAYRKGYYKLMNDIDLTDYINQNNTSEGWQSIGRDGSETIHFDGNGKKIAGLWCNSTRDNTGLFSCFANGTIKNLTVEVASGKQVKGGANTGILIGKMINGTIENCKVSGKVADGTPVGGMVGLMDGGKISLCQANVTINTTGNTSYVGGLVGEITGGEIDQCVTLGALTATGTSSYVGGMVGKNYATVTNCYSNANVTSSYNAAGLIAYNYGLVEKCYATGNLSSNNYAAGVIGYNDGENAVIKNCAAMNNKIDLTFESQSAQSGGYGQRIIGGIKNGAPAPELNNYALKTMQVSLNNKPQPVSDDIMNGAGKTGSELMKKTTYQSIGWDFANTWSISEGESYPALKNNVASVIAGDNTDDGSGVNTLSGVDLQTSAGSKVVLPINLNNENEVKLCQFDLQLPAGVTVATKSNGKLDAKLTERAETHTISSQQLSNGNYRFIISSMDNDSFTGNSGTLVEITLDIPATMEAGEYTVKLLNAELSVPDGNDLKVVKPADTESKLTIKAYTPGDVNNDGSVSVTDVGCAINYILEQVPSVFIFDAADMNGDKSVSVTDVGMIINLILNEGATASPKLNRTAVGNAHLTQQPTTDGYRLQLGNKDTFIGFQMDLQVTNGANINGMELIGGEDHLMTYRQLANGTWRVICYSPTNSTFEGNEAGLLNISTIGDVTISNVRLTTADLSEISIDTISTETTGIIDRLVNQNEELKVYTLDGRLCRTIRVQQGENPLNGLKAGVYMIGNRKVVVR